MNLVAFFKDNWKHFAVIFAFFVLMLNFFGPEFDGFSLKQHDVEQHKGMSNEVAHHREIFDEEPLWTNAMFGGMPATQISVLYDGNLFQKGIIGFLRFFGVPSGIFLLHLLGFYILALCLKIRPMVAFIGAVAFAFATYEIVIIQAGHNSKAVTVALMAPVLGAFILAYRSNWKWGVLLSSLFMCFEIASNHLQVTYYLAILLVGLGVYELIRALKAKELKQFFIISGSLIGAYLLALFINYGNINMTNEYAKHTIRGGNDITINPDGTNAKQNSGGLDKDYITTWSYGIGESFTLLSPYIKGSASVGINDSKFKEVIEDSDRTPAQIKEILTAPYPLYWGEQPIVSGPTYVGVVMVFIMILGLFYLDDKRKWVLFGVGLLALVLSWGKNFMGLTELFIDYIPGYNKFRTVTIIMVLIELVVPLIGVLFLEQLFKNRDVLKTRKKLFLIASGAFVVFLLGLKVIGLGDNYTSSKDLAKVENVGKDVMNYIQQLPSDQLAQNGIDLNNGEQLQAIVSAETDKAEDQLLAFKGAREDMFNSSMNRSILFVLGSIIVFALYFYSSISTYYVIVGLAVLVLSDMIPVNLNYLNSDELRNGDYKHWVAQEEILYPLSPTPADYEILKAEVADPITAKAIEEGTVRGKKKAIDLEYSGVSKNRVIDSYKFSALNYATNYRVFTYNNPWGSSRASYFHKNLGGYHGAKLRNIQNIFEFQLSAGNNKIFDLLNVKYFIQGQAMRPNPSALGNVWFVKSVKESDTPNDEIRALGSSFMLENKGLGRLLVNEQEVTISTVFGLEKMVYIGQNGDTIPVQLSNGMAKGLEALMVTDALGNTDLIPAITLALDTLNSFTTLVSITVMDEFNPREEAVMLSSEAKKLTKKEFSGDGSAKMMSYKPNQIDYEIELDEKQFAVFSEIYYPFGWKAFVDGKEQEILKVDYLLRGLELSKGKHKVSFVYDVPQYHTASLMAISGTSLLFLGLFGFLFYESKKKNVATKG